MATATPHPSPAEPLRPDQPLRVGTRGSPLALIQTRDFLQRIRSASPVQSGPPYLPARRFIEHVVRTTGDATQAAGIRLAEIGGKGLFSKEIHEALADGRIDVAVHSLKDLETVLPEGIVLACTLQREDPRDVLIRASGCASADPADPFAKLPAGAVVGTASVRRQAQLLHARADLKIVGLRGNVQTRLDKLAAGACAATLLAAAGLRRLGLGDPTWITLDTEVMVPAVGQGIIGVTAREKDTGLRGLLAAIEDPEARVVARAERAMLAALDGSCRTPIGGHARLLQNGELHLTGLVARPDGSYLLKRTLTGSAADGERIGAELGASLRADSPHDVFG
jgi:hydroxymethylbilane synthase